MIEQPVAGEQIEQSPPVAAGAGKEGRRGRAFPLNPTALLVVLVAVASFAGGYLTHKYLAPLSLEERRQLQESQFQAAAPAAGEVAAQPIAVEVGDDPFLGPAGAPVTIVEFSDFQCPFCERFHAETFDQIMTTYEGQVRFVYRDFPLSNIHPNAQKAAEAAQCAHEQGQFWPMHDRLFATQVSWANDANATAQFKASAREIGLDAARFDACLDSGQYAREVAQDFQEGMGYGVTGTPTFFVNGRRISGAQPFAAYQAVIEEELGRQ